MKKILINSAVLVGSLALFGMANAAVTPFGDASVLSSGGNPGYTASITSDASVAPYYGGISFDDMNGQIFSALTNLSTDFNVTDDNCGGGSPRVEIAVTNGSNTGNIFVYLGPSPSYDTCTPNTWVSTGNLLDGGAGHTLDTSKLPGGNFYDTDAHALSAYGAYTITGMDIVDDSSWDAVATGGDGEMTTLLDNTVINSTTYSYGPPPSVTTDPATAITMSDATLNATNGPVAGDHESFWVSTSPINTSSPNIPAGVYSTPVLSGVGAGAAFSDPLSLVTTNGIVTGGNPGNMPAITPGTTYYFVAWVEVGGNWYPGEVLSVVIPIAAGSCPAGTVQSASPLETDMVNSNSDTPTLSTHSLSSGKSYVLVSSGTWQNSNINVVDPMYASLNNWTTYQEGYDSTPFFLGPEEFNLELNGAFTNWGPYNGTNHSYQYLYNGTGSKVNFLVFDGNSNDGSSSINPAWYGDNSGTLSVAIYECVKPSKVTVTNNNNATVTVTTTSSSNSGGNVVTGNSNGGNKGGGNGGNTKVTTGGSGSSASSVVIVNTNISKIKKH